MKHFNLLKTTLLLCALIVGGLSGWADEVTITQESLGLTGSYTTNTEKTIGGITYVYTDLMKSNANIQAKATSGVIYNKTAFPGDITSVVITHSGTARATTISGSSDGTNWTLVKSGNGSITVDFSNKGYRYFKITRGSYAAYWTQIVVSYSTGAPTKVSTPSILGDELFFNSTDVSISCNTDGASIVYSTDNGANWNAYTAPFTLTATTTVKAKATKESLTSSDETEKTFTKIVPMTVAEAIDYIDAGENLTGQYVTGKISQIDSYGSNAITYWISDDGTTTKQMQVYKGKGLNGANFSAKSDLEIGDVVIVRGTLNLFNSSVYEFDQNSVIVSRVEKPESDITKTSDITLDFKNADTMADLTDYFTTSSTGAITYTIGDGTIVERDDEIISALKVGTTTVTVSQAGDLSYKSGEIVIDITVQDTRVPATTIPAINISTLKKGDADGTISVLEPVKADDGVTFSFVSDNEDVLLIDGTTYTVGEIGTAKVTVTATPSDFKLYTAVVKTFDVTVEAATKTDNEIVLDAASGSVVYGTPKSVDYAVVDGYDGEMAYTIDNGAIADVAIGATAITFTPKAVGTAIVTISAPATTTFNAAEDVTYTLTVNAPTGGTVAAVSSTTIFTETFDECNGTGANDGKWSGSIASGTPIYDNSGWTLSGGGKANKCVKLNKGENIESPSISLGGASELQVSFKVAGWNAESGDVTLSCNDDKAKLSTTTVAFVATEWNTRNFTISGIENASIKIKFATPSGKRIFIDDVVVSVPGVDITTKLNAYGYATFCSEYPLDFSEATGYTAWQVKGTSGSEITFEKVTGSVKGGTGIFLMGEANAAVTLKSADSDNVLSSNMLTGTLAPTYVTTVNGDYTNFGLSGDKFVKINNGTVKANKAYLPILTSNVPGTGARLSLVFENETDGIETINKVQMTNDGYFDLQGRKVAQPTKGLYIFNGKKVVKK